MATQEDLAALQKCLGLPDGKMAQAFGVTRMTWLNWKSNRRGKSKRGLPALPDHVALAADRLIQILRIDPTSQALPEAFRRPAPLSRHLVTAEVKAPANDP